MDPLGFLGISVILVAWMTFTKSGKRAGHQLRANYRDRMKAWQGKHPDTVALARFAGAIGALVHGVGPAWKAFKHDWSRDWAEAKERVEARYARHTPEPIEPNANNANRASVIDPQRPSPRKRTVPRPVPDPVTAAEPPERAAASARPVLTLVQPTQPAAKGTAAMPTPVTTEINGVQGLHDYLADAVATAQAKFDDASDAAQRARTYLGQVRHASENAPRILNRDPGLASKIAQLIEPAQQDVKNEEAREQIAADQLAGAQAALADLAVHLKTAEAVQENANVSTNTSVYQDA